MDEIKRRKLKRVHTLMVTRAMWTENRTRAHKMMVQLRWNCLPQALLLLILILGHLSMLIQVQLLFRMGGTSCVYTSDFLDFRKLTQCIYDMLQPPLSGNLKHYPITKHLYIWQPNIRIFTSGMRNSNYK